MKRFDSKNGRKVSGLIHYRIPSVSPLSKIFLGRKVFCQKSCKIPTPRATLKGGIYKNSTKTFRPKKIFDIGLTATMTKSVNLSTSVIG